MMATSAYGQEFSMRMWHDGMLVTTSRDTLHGMLKYDMPTNSLQLYSPRDESRRVLTFGSKKVMYFEFYDQNLGHYRKFYAIPYQIRRDFKAPVLFEILYEGELSLLSREQIVFESDPYQSYSIIGGTIGSEQLIYSFYFVDQSGKIQFFSGKKNDLIVMLPKHQNLVRNYVNSNKLKLEQVNDLVRVVAYYNSL